MSNVKVCTIAVANKPVMESVLKRYQIEYTFEQFTNERGESGYRVSIPLNYRIFFSEVLMSKYKTEVELRNFLGTSLKTA